MFSDVHTTNTNTNLLVTHFSECIPVIKLRMTGYTLQRAFDLIIPGAHASMWQILLLGLNFKGSVVFNHM